jgi:hypothetical protein
MADKDKLPEQIADALKDVEEVTGVNVQMTAAKVARNAYTAHVAAISLTIPLVVGGPASLSQEQTRRPDESVPAQGQAAEAVSEGSAIILRVLSAGVSTRNVMTQRSRK